MGWVTDQVLGFLVTAVQSSLNTLWTLVARTLFWTPDVTGFPQVREMHDRAMMVVNTSYVLAIMLTGVLVMANGTVQMRNGLAELAPRLVIAFVASNFTQPICRGFITAANVLVQALTGANVADQGALVQVLRTTTSAANVGPSQVLMLVLVIIIACLVAMLLVTWVTRLVKLVVLSGLGPLAVAAHASPYSEPLAQAWWSNLAGCTATVALQAVALHTSLSIFLSPEANMPATGLPQDPSGTFNLFLVACLLWMTVRIPKAVGKFVNSGRQGQNVLGAMVRLVVVQQLTHGLGAAFGGGRAAGAMRGAAGRTAGPTGAWTPAPRSGPASRLPAPQNAAGHGSRLNQPARQVPRSGAGRGSRPAATPPRPEPPQPGSSGGAPGGSALGRPSRAPQTPRSRQLRQPRPGPAASGSGPSTSSAGKWQR